jgi:hypothetical protein
MFLLTMVFLYFGLISAKTKQNKYLRIGPNEDLIFFGILINTYKMYTIILFTLIINAGIRTINTNIMTPWIIQNIQNDDKIITINTIYIYQITFISVIYTWFDWLYNLNLALIQIDMIIIELIIDIIINMFITKYYMKKKNIYQIII